MGINRKKYFFIFLTLPLVTSSLLLAGEPLPLQPKREVIVISPKQKPISLQCEVVENPATRNRGLMFRKSLGANDCMLFIFEKEQILHFWMKDTSIPLSIAFINSKGKIVSIKDMTPFSTELISSDHPAIYAVEMNRGWFQKQKIIPGDFVKIIK